MSFEPLQGDMAMADKRSYQGKESANNVKESTAIDEEHRKAHIIRNANISGEVKDYKQSMLSLKSILKGYDAYVFKENERQYSHRLQNQITIKVKEEQFFTLSNKLQKLIDHDLSKTISADDVSKQVIDLESRLKTKQAALDRYRTFLETAKNVEELLKIERYILNLQEEIESAQASLNHFLRQSAESTIILDIHQPISTPVTVQKGFKFWPKLTNSFFNGWEGLLTFIIGITNLWPLFLIFGIGAFTLYRLIRNGQKRISSRV